MNFEAFRWGAAFALVAALVVILASMGSVTADNVLLSEPYRAAGGGFLWGVLVWNVRDWLISRRL